MSHHAGLVVVLVTASSVEEAQRIAAALLDGRRAACVNIVPQVSSSFWWQGKVDSAHETLLIVKTTQAALDDAVKLIKAVHSYTVPEVIALPIVGGNPDYLAWVGSEVR